MNTVFVILEMVGVYYIVLAHYHFIENTRYDQHDAMGAAASFNQSFSLGTILLTLGIGVSGVMKWPYCVGLFIGLNILSLPYRWFVLDKIMASFRKPSPE